MKKEKLPTVKFIYDRKKGGKLIEVVLYFKLKQERLYVSTGVKTDYWDKALGYLSPNDPDYFTNNATLKEITEEINTALYNLKHSTYSYDKESFSNFFRKRNKDNSEKVNFIIFAETELAMEDLVPGTRRHNQRSLNLLKEFKQPIYMHELNYDFISKFNHFLHKKEIKPGVFFSQNTVRKHLVTLKKYAAIAAAKNFISSDALNNIRSFRIQSYTSGKFPLSDEELSAIEDLKLDVKDKKRIHRDMFLFSCYTGLRISDVLSITPGHFQKIDGQIKLTKIMVKLQRQKKTVTLPVEKLFNGKPYTIIKPYLSSKEEHEVIFDKSAPDVNRVLKEVAIAAKIRPITFHVSRHTFLTNLAAKTGNVFVVMEYGGIGSISTAQNYIKLAQKRLDKGLDDIIW